MGVATDTVSRGWSGPDRSGGRSDDPELQHMVAELDRVAVAQGDGHRALDPDAVHPAPVARRVDHHDGRAFGIHPQFEVIARDGQILAQDDSMGLVDAGTLSADEQPVAQRQGGFDRSAGVHHDVGEG